MGRKHTRLFLSAAFLGLAGAVSPTAAYAQNAAADRQLSFAIPAQSLSSALRQLAEVSGLQLVYDTNITDGKSSSGVSGTMSAKAALAQLLAGSGLNFQFSGDRTVIITADAGGATAAANGGVRSAGVVTVEGSTGNMPYGDLVSPVNGVNGSRDVEATEGTGSYTTGAASVATKIPQTPRETPQSISVVTAQQIQDQNLVSVKDILDRLPGITSTPGANGEEFDVYSRGFKVETYTYDGGAPVSYSYGNRPVIDMSEFDNVQLVRGADGLYGGYGNPGGVVNLVRKKPLDRQQITYSQDIGSFSFFREELDVTGPLTKDRRLRGRFVAARQDNDFFYDVAYARKTSAYGSLEYDLDPRTLLTIGASYNREDNRPNQGGLPRYVDGTAIDFPRSTCLCLKSNFDRARKTEFYATFNHQFSDNIALKINGVYTDQTVDASYYGVSSVVAKNGNNQGTLGGYASFNPSKQITLDFTLNGAFGLFGRRHQFVIGSSYVYANNDGGTTTFLPNIDVADIFKFDPNAYPAPDTNVPPFYIGLRSRIEQIGAYAATRLEILKWLHVNLGVRYNYSAQSLLSQYSFSPDPQVSSPIGASNLSKPAVGVTVDFLKNFTAYASHQDTYKPQTYVQYLPGETPPPPVIGSNDEVGLKFQSSSKKFNASVAYYRVIQNGFLTTDYANPGNNLPYLQDTKSEGVDVEATGELFAGFQIAASYTYNNNSTTTAAYPTGTQSSPATSFAPKHKVKIWVTYRPPVNSGLSRLIVGGGVDSQSSAFSVGYVCANPSPTDPNANCPNFNFIPYSFATKGYTTYSAKLGYRLTNNVELSIVGRNLTNVKAYANNPAQNVAGYNFYIPPFTALGSVHVRF